MKPIFILLLLISLNSFSQEEYEDNSRTEIDRCSTYGWAVVSAHLNSLIIKSESESGHGLYIPFICKGEVHYKVSNIYARSESCCGYDNVTDISIETSKSVVITISINPNFNGDNSLCEITAIEMVNGAMTVVDYGVYSKKEVSDKEDIVTLKNGYEITLLDNVKVSAIVIDKSTCYLKIPNYNFQ